MSLSTLSIGELRKRLTHIDQRLGELRGYLESNGVQSWRTLKLTVGSLATFVGIALAPPTGGASAFLAGAGLLLWAEGFREDAALSNRAREAAAETERLLLQMDEIRVELRRRGVRIP